MTIQELNQQVSKLDSRYSVVTVSDSEYGCPASEVLLEGGRQVIIILHNQTFSMAWGSGFKPYLPFIKNVARLAFELALTSVDSRGLKSSVRGAMS
ncbi:MAG TPA: hypothetical protein H9875_08510 [Candidatus Levilactobacillus faecigallinarum]|uniref:Uncharacterized protein n=1 Tax=Candidatus Levilactobacillus faecigallinarum TaxID=2838638 RepID=A0A9D1QSG1_9LACO|nr:hypothetical protein [Candidatus Levilactobacillus faecigallinarum]